MFVVNDLEHIEGGVITIQPNSHFGKIVHEVVSKAEAAIFAERIRSFRHSHALRVRRSDAFFSGAGVGLVTNGKLGEDPSFVCLVVLNNADVLIRNDELIVNGSSYGLLKQADAITVDHGKVLINEMVAPAVPRR